MPTIAQLSARARTPITIQFRGADLEVRWVPVGVMDQVRRCLPEPTPPEDPLSREPNLADPDYRDMVAERQANLTIIQIAIAIGLTDNAGRGWTELAAAERAAWIRHVVAWGREDLADEEGGLLLRAVQQAGLAGGKACTVPPSYAAVTVGPDGSRHATS